MQTGYIGKISTMGRVSKILFQDLKVTIHKL